MRREDYIAPGGMMAEQAAGARFSIRKAAADRGPQEARAGGEGSKPAPKGPPAIKLAPLPPSSMVPPPKSAAEEPAPQKPDLRLPADAIRASKAGSKPLQEHSASMSRSARPTLSASRASAATARNRCRSHCRRPARRGRERRRGKAAAPKAGEGDEFVSALGGREARQLARKRTGTTRKASATTTSPSSRLPPRLSDQAHRLRQHGRAPQRQSDAPTARHRP